MKKLLILFLILGVVFPFFSFSAGTYRVVKMKEDPETGKEEVEYEFEVEYEGLIPCGKCLDVKSGNPEYQDVELQRCGANKKFIPCQICHIFILISEVIKFFYSELLWPLLGVLITILGFLLLLSEIHPIVFTGQGNVFFAIEKIKEGIKLTAFSFFFLLALWFLLNLFFTVMGVGEWTGLKDWFKISCTIKELPLAPQEFPVQPPTPPPPPPPPPPPGTSGCPVNGGSITSPFVCRFHPTHHCWRMHNGIDIVSSDKTIYAANSGTVIKAGQISNDCGVGVKIKHDDGYTSEYCHLRSTNVSPGQKVEKGSQIGIMDSTGASSGDHLHFGIMDSQGNYQNPESFIANCNYSKNYNQNSSNYDWSGEKCRNPATRCE
jgi:hypothetical protein